MSRIYRAGATTPGLKQKARPSLIGLSRIAPALRRLGQLDEGSALK